MAQPLPNISKLSPEQLERLTSEIAARKAHFQARRALADKVQKMAEAEGIPLAELLEDLGAALRSRKRAENGAPKAAAAAAPVKYRHPGTGETWTGRGKQPVWLRDEIAKGKRPEDFAVAAG